MQATQAPAETKYPGKHYVGIGPTVQAVAFVVHVKQKPKYNEYPLEQTVLYVLLNEHDYVNILGEELLKLT